MNRRDEGNRDDGRAAATVADMFRARVCVWGKSEQPVILVGIYKYKAVRDWWKFEYKVKQTRGRRHH